MLVYQRVYILLILIKRKNSSRLCDRNWPHYSVIVFWHCSIHADIESYYVCILSAVLQANCWRKTQVKALQLGCCALTNLRRICFAFFLHSEVWTFEAFKQISPFIYCVDLYHLMTPNDATKSISFKTTKAVIEIRYWRGYGVRVVSGLPVRLDHRHWSLGTYLTTWPVSHPILRDYDKYQVAFMTSVAILELRDALKNPNFTPQILWNPRPKKTPKNHRRVESEYVVSARHGGSRHSFIPSIRRFFSPI